MKKRMKSKKDSNRLQFYLAWSVLALSFIVFFVSFPWNIVEVKTLDVKYMVSDKAGFDLNATVLSYGSLLPGSKGTRIINLENNYDFPIYTTFHPNNDIDDLLFFNRTKQTILAGGNLSLPITLIVPSDESHGNYTSFIVVKIRK